MSDQLKHLDEDRAMGKEMEKEFGPDWSQPVEAPRPQITIPAPLAEYGDRVVVANYRIKTGDNRELGTVRGIKFNSIFGELPSWTYDVFIDSKRYYVYVGDEGIIEKLD